MLSGTPNDCLPAERQPCVPPVNGEEIAPAAKSGASASIRIRRRCLPNTLILETEFSAADGSTAAIIDFMPVRQGRLSSHLVRLVVGRRGTMAMHTELIVRFGYGGTVPWVMQNATGGLLPIAGPDMLLLRAPVPLRGEGLSTVGDFTVSAGEQVPFVLSYGPSHKPVPEPPCVEEALLATQEFWRSWAGIRRSTDQPDGVVTRSRAEPAGHGREETVEVLLDEVARADCGTRSGMGS